eukprot:TRINITY_DN10313_c0_g1_i1.p1 TRINITY_DN10313_c0_g1~~TRINITY_DN10313_c0_g1_i1.p1  ORF type:complete len:168 (-),score=44.57 TRINITY_DN10313_c0_g1_i1:17-520(-)
MRPLGVKDEDEKNILETKSDKTDVIPKVEEDSDSSLKSDSLKKDETPKVDETVSDSKPTVTESMREDKNSSKEKDEREEEINKDQSTKALEVEEKDEQQSFKTEPLTQSNKTDLETHKKEEAPVVPIKSDSLKQNENKTQNVDEKRYGGSVQRFQNLLEMKHNRRHI